VYAEHCGTHHVGSAGFPIRAVWHRGDTGSDWGLRMRGLIAGTTARGSQFIGAGRVQLLIVSLVTAAQYLTQVWASPQRLPEIPQNWLLFFGGSQMLYLGSKFNGKRNNHFQV
jgi:hypothetical protein